MVSKVRGDFREAIATITIAENPLESSVSPYGHDVFGFSATAEINREDWGLTTNLVLETGGFMISKQVKIEIEGEALYQS